MKSIRCLNIYGAILMECLRLAIIFCAFAEEVAGIMVKCIESKLRALSGEVFTVSYEETLHGVCANVKMNTPDPDASLHILILETSCVDLCKWHVWKFLEQPIRTAIKDIINIGEHTVLKRCVNDDILLVQRNLKDCLSAFFYLSSGEIGCAETILIV